MQKYEILIKFVPDQQQTTMVPASSLALIAVNAVLGVAVPVALTAYLIRKHSAQFSTILIGASTFIVFALVLERIMHQMVLKGPLGATIRDSVPLYAVYGGLAAGIFEETGRLISMKFLMKKEPSTPLPAIAYGTGHGGAEMIILFGLTMISNLVIAILINSGQSEMILSSVPAETASQVQAQFDTLQDVSAGNWLLGLWERFSALILQIALSIFVWTAVRKGGKWFWLFPAAILLHALVDAGAVLLQHSVGLVALESIVMVEVIVVAVIALLVARVAYRTE